MRGDRVCSRLRPVGADGRPLGHARHALLVLDAGRQHVLGLQHALRRPGLGRRGDRPRRRLRHPQRPRRGHEQQRAAGPRVVDLDVREHRAQGGEQRAQERLVHELLAHPGHEHAVVAQPVAHQLEELTGEEVRRSGGPRVRGLGHDRVEAAPGEQQRAPRVVQADEDARILEGVASAAPGQRLVGAHDLRLQLHHVDRLDRGRHVLGGLARAQAHDHHRAGLGPRRDREQRQPVSHAVSAGTRAGSLDRRLGQAVGGEPPFAALVDDRHGGPPARRRSRRPCPRCAPGCSSG